MTPLTSSVSLRKDSMDMKLKLAFPIFLILFIVGCSDSFKEEYKKSYDESFRKSFRASFIKSCTESSGDDKFIDTCTCIADDLLEGLSVQELKDKKKVIEYVKKISSKKCKIKLKKG